MNVSDESRNPRFFFKGFGLGSKRSTVEAEGKIPVITSNLGFASDDTDQDESPPPGRRNDGIFRPGLPNAQLGMPQGI